MSVYNGERYLKDCIYSILNQTYTNFEFLIIDDDSKDNTLEILEEFKKKDSRIKVYKNNENKGLTKNLNYLIKHSEGNLIARMDSDDIAFSERFEKQVKYLTDHPDVDIIGSSAIDIDENNKQIRKRTVPIKNDDIKKMMLKLDPFIHPTVMFRKKSLEKINFYDERYRTSQDYDMWFRAMSVGLNFYNIEEPLLYYRYESNYTKKRKMKFRINDFKIRYNGYKINKISFVHWYKLFIPIILGILPNSLYNLLKKFDPR